MLRALIVDDERLARQKVRTFLEARSDVAIAGEAANVDDAIKLVASTRPDLVLLDMYMPRMTGLELLAKMRQRGLRTPVLMLTGNEDNRSAANALAGGIFAYVPKPFDLNYLEQAVSIQLSARRRT